jgi:hypothetical protein
LVKFTLPSAVNALLQQLLPLLIRAFRKVREPTVCSNHTVR